MLTAALLILSILVVTVLMQSRQRQQTLEQEYFAFETEATMENLRDKMMEFDVVAAQLNQNDLLAAFLTENNTWQRYQYYQYIKDLMTILLSNNSSITNVDLFLLDGTHYAPTDTDSYLSRTVLENYDITDPACMERRFVLIDTYRSDQYSQFAYLTPIYALNNGKKIATLALFGTCRRLLASNEESYVDVWLTDELGNSYPSAMPQEVDATFDLGLGLRVAFKQMRPYVDTANESMLRLMLPMIIIMPLILLAIGALLVHQLTHPVLQLSQQMELVRQNRQTSVRITRGGRELSELCTQINEMLYTIKQRNNENMLIHDQLYQAELMKVEAQLYALRNQINPHFLYNTLQTIGGMALACGVREISRIASNMASIFRYSVHEDGLAKLKEEMAIATKYMYIMNVRHDNRFQYTWSVENAVENCMVPRMIVQPVIENAVKYAFEPTEAEAQIDVLCLRDGDMLKIILSDNGCGLSDTELQTLCARMKEPVSLKKTGQSGGLGLHNIHQRLLLRYGKAYGVSISSTLGSGTRIELRLPFNPHHDVNEKANP